MAAALRTILAILATALMGFGIPTLAAVLTARSWPALPFPPEARHGLPGLYVHHAFQLALALVAIAALKPVLRRDFGLHRPRGPSCYGAALFWGLAFGVLMFVVDHGRGLLAGQPIDLGYALTPGNAAGWLVFEGLYVGPTEEIPFRALLVTFLAAFVPARLRVGGREIGAAGVIVAAMFALAHAGNFATRPWPEALGQQLYAFALGVFYAAWLERSRSILAPILGHNVGDVSETALEMGWVALH
jgi:uncharacterized protein